MQKTQDRNIANEYRVEDKTNLSFIKDPAIKQYYANKTRYVNLFSKHEGRYYLPRSSYNVQWLVLDTKLISWLSLRDYQMDAVSQILSSKTKWWMIRSWESTGKTRMMLATRIWSKRQCVIVVPNKTIQTWIVKEFSSLWHTILPVSWSKTDIDPWVSYVVCSKTLLLLYDKLNDWNRSMIIDECHHIPDNTIKSINLWQWCVYWFTASPIRKEFGIEWFHILYGTVHETWQEWLPIHVFWITFDNKYTMEEWLKASEWLPTDHYEIYRRLLNNDTKRREKIIKICLAAFKKHNRVIVFCDRIWNSAQLLYDDISNIVNDVYLLTWKTSNQNIAERLANQDRFLIVASTGCACEWLDIPSLNCWILVFNTSFIKSIRQMAWRMRRRFKDKSYWVFIDIQDKITLWDSKPYRWGISKRKAIYKELWFTFKPIVFNETAHD